MKKVLIISSTPRVEGNSEIIAKEFAKGAKDAGHQVEFISLREYKINYCTGCYACSKLDKCYQNDDMNTLAPKLLEADVIMFATPVYFYSMSGQLKVFIDRLIPVYRKVRADIYLVATAWDSNINSFDLTFEAIRGCTRECFSECKEKGAIAGAGLWERKEAYDNKEYLKIAYDMGMNC